MKCPKCNQEMKKGYLISDALVQWIPEGKKGPILAFVKTKEGVLLNNYEEGLRNYKAEAYYCETCKMVVAPTEE